MLKIGFYEKEITPPLGCHIPGYFNIRRSEDVIDRLYARAMAVSSDDEIAVIISVDAVDIGADVLDDIYKRIEKYISVDRSHVMIGATHSHTAIPRKEHLDDPDIAESTEGYHTVVAKLIADCAILAHRRLKECSVSFGKGEVDGISFCRDYYMKNATPQTNPPRTSPEIDRPTAETDNELPILFVKDADGEPLGALISFACHPDCVSGEKYTGDYISVLAKQLKKAYGEDFVTVFLQGTSGDINHFDVSKPSDAPDHYRKMGQKIAGEAIKSIAFAAELESDELKVAYEVLPIERTTIDDEKIEKAKYYIENVKPVEGVKVAADGTDSEQYNLMMSRSLMRFLENTPAVMNVPVQVFQIGEFTVYAMPSEIYCYFGKLIKRGDGTGKCMVATLCNGTFGYVPTRDMFYDTIYESKPGANKLNREAGYIMAEKLLSMKK